MIISEEFRARLGRCDFLQFAKGMSNINQNFSKKPKPFLFLIVNLHVFLTNQRTLESEFCESSSEDLGSDVCQLWNLDFGWVHDDTHQVDSSLLCSMFSPDFRDIQELTQELQQELCLDLCIELPVLTAVCKA